VSALIAALCIAASPGGANVNHGPPLGTPIGFTAADLSAADHAALVSRLESGNVDQSPFIGAAGSSPNPASARAIFASLGRTTDSSSNPASARAMFASLGRGSNVGCGAECSPVRTVGCGPVCEPGCGPEAGCGGCGPSRCRPTWTFFGEALYLRPRDAEVAYAVPFNGPAAQPPAVPIQIGPLGMVDPDYDVGFRVGYETVFNDCTSIGVTYTRFETDTRSAIATQAPFVVRSMVSHPSTFGATSDGLQASARYDLDFALVDADVRGVIACGPCYLINWVGGARYATSEHQFSSQFAVNGRETVLTNIQFDGAGLRVGLEGERHARKGGWMVYGKGAASFTAGEFRAFYGQGQAFDASVVATRWKAGRIVSMLDLELGAGWTSPNGCLRLTAGYMVSAWYNVVMTDEFIHAVQTNNFIDLGDTITFDGLVVRAEYRF